MDVFGLDDKPENDKETVYQELKERTTSTKRSWMVRVKVDLEGKPPTLPHNEAGTWIRLERDENYQCNDNIIQEQHKSEIILQEHLQNPQEINYYMPHKRVSKEDAKSTKL